MTIKSGRISVTQNESKYVGLMNLFQCTQTGRDGIDCVAWTSKWLSERIPRNFMECPFLCIFRAALGFEEWKTSSPSKNPVYRSLFCVNSNEQYGRCEKNWSSWG